MKYVSTLPIETVIVINPHAIAYSDYIHISHGKHASGDFSQFHAGNVRIEVDYDTELVKKISICQEASNICRNIRKRYWLDLCFVMILFIS